jgi:uncharacterized protein YndB with AHSA1/START domain
MPRTDTASREIAAPPEQVYAALVDPAALTAWLPPRGMTGRFDHFEARPGGSYRMVLTYADGETPAGKMTADSDVVEANFVEIVPGRRVVQDVDFVSDDPRFRGTMTMTWEVTPVDEGTRVDVRAEDVQLAESVSIAMLTVLETLVPAERAVFVLREVFDSPYVDIAGAIEKSPAAVRQIAHRARDHVAARRPRIEVDRGEQQRVVDHFLAALQTGDVQGLLDVLAPDVVLIADGGGEATAVRRPILGREKVARLLSRFQALAPQAAVGTVWLNGAPAARVDLGGALDTAVSLAIADGRITGIYAIRNPSKLARLDEEATLQR